MFILLTHIMTSDLQTVNLRRRLLENKDMDTCKGEIRVNVSLALRCIPRIEHLNQVNRSRLEHSGEHTGGRVLDVNP